MNKLKLLAIALLCAITASANGADDDVFSNPVMPGFNPDPSICRVGDDYYMVTSSFTWFPGIPIYHSRDLVNWELIAHALDQPGTIDTNGLNDNDGTWAATIRHHNGLFYLTATASKCGGNFYMTATDPRGPWSAPVWLDDAPGIDPSLFFDDDGRCYYTGNRWDFKKQWKGQCGVWVQELDLERGELKGERKIIAYGHASNAAYAEGPHLYKIGGRYMLLMAEGGSGANHAVTVFHSDSVFGPYTADMVNPVLTHRHLGKNHLIWNVGHADLVQTQAGDWYAVALGNRMTGGMSTLGRETFLCKVDFENGTPIFNAGHGCVLDSMERPRLPLSPVKPTPDREDFNGAELPMGWYTVRTPRNKFFSLSKGWLNVALRPQVMDSLVNSSLLLRKIPDLNFTATTALSFSTGKANEQAGLALYRTANGYFALLKGKSGLQLVRKLKGERAVVAQVPYDKETVFVRITVDGAEARFYFSGDNSDWTAIGGGQSMEAVADDGKYNKFNGTGIGVYATSNGKKTKAVARYDWFEYKKK